MHASLGAGYNYVISPDAAARLSLVVDKTSESNPQIVLRAPSDLSGDDIHSAREVASGFPGE
jgi:hypothetical protein